MTSSPSPGWGSPSPTAGARSPKQLLLSLPDEDPILRQAQDRLAAGRKLVLAGLVPAAKAFYLRHLHQRLRRHVILVTPDEERAADLLRHLRALAALDEPDLPAPIFSFPTLGADPYQGVAPHFRAMADRVESLVALRRQEPALVVATAAALLQPLPEPDEFASRLFVLASGEVLEPRALAAHLVELGYKRVDLVEEVGSFALRGGVLDVFPPQDRLPRRLEFLGDQIESIRRFDPKTQRSEEHVPRLELSPVQEFGWSPEQASRLARRIQGRAGSRTRIEEMAEALVSRGHFPGMEGCVAMVAAARYDLLDHAEGALLVVDEPFLTRTALEGAVGELEDSHASSEEIFPPPADLFNPLEPLLRQLGDAPMAVAQLAVEEDPEQVLSVAAATVRNYRGRIKEVARDLQSALARGTRVLVLVRGAGRAQRVRELLHDHGIEALDADGEARAGTELVSGVYLGHAALEGGFELRDHKLLLLTEHEVFGEVIRHRPPRRALLAAFQSDFRDLKPGDLVVHIDHGIGRFDGLRQVGPEEGDGAEMMCLVYRGNDRLFVPLDRLDLVQKYSGMQRKVSSLDKLGGTAWQKTRTKARKAIRDMTEELLQLYARRKAMTGFAFAEDTEWQREFEDAFEFQETPDQERAIREIKADLEAPRAMDRLLCGDVGFGKTEVAMRAAFKVVMEARQVALLSPTTVLAFQHERTLRQRFASFPVRVEMLSRFTPRPKQKEILAAVASGEVDILVGTHRLLSKDLHFSKLGLLIIDEEQRFGVVHKERLKQMSAGVDVLSMSATPIPRTLQMSLAGVRDMSVIETPPENRLAIQTSLVPFREGVIRDAIRHEMARHGQVYFVHNRVESIYSMADYILKLVPECRVAVAHGQMPEHQLEKAMLEFVAGEQDVLVSTTIIENGLDLPRVNTLLVNRADRFGLSQLYQLRGRIGRSDLQAYAYLMVPPGGVNQPLARRRLAALQEFSELGSGFRIAAMDLELRGAGNLLGSEQHGHVAAVGFEMYCRMIESAVRELEGEEVAEIPRTTIQLGVDIRLPESFIQESNQRLMVYKRIASAEDDERLGRVREEMIDRFGALPPQGEDLFRLASLRLLAVRLHVRSVDFQDGALQVKFAADTPVEADRLVKLIGTEEGISLTSSGLLRVACTGGADERLGRAERLFHGLA